MKIYLNYDDILNFSLIWLVHEIFTTLAGNGEKGPFFVKTKSPKLTLNLFSPESGYICYVPILKNSTTKDIGPAERSMIAYLYYMVNIAQFLRPGDFLLFDGESSFRTAAVQQWMKKYKLNPIVIEPSQLHQFLNPCDNHFHSVFKLSYYRSLSKLNCSHISDEKKLLLAFQCYHAISRDSIISMFRKCGLITNQNKRDVILKLVAEGLEPVGASNLHKVNLMSYLRWCKNCDLVSLCSSISKDILVSIGLCI